MANTYTQIYIHIVFAVQGRQNLMTKDTFSNLQIPIRCCSYGADRMF
jgi:hypothetical protein